MNIQVNVQVVDGSNVVSNLPLFLNEVIVKRSEIMGLDLAAGASEVLGLGPVGYVKGILISSENRIKVESLVSGEYDIRGIGKRIFIDELNVGSLKITNLDQELDVGEIGSINEAGVNDIITAVDKNYTHSLLTGTKVDGPFNISGTKFLFSIYGYSTIYFDIGTITITDSGGDPLTNAEVAANVAAALKAQINENMNFTAVDVSYDTDAHKFVVKAALAGAYNIEFTSNIDYLTAELFIGMSDPTLQLGTDDYAGKKLEMLSGNDAGNTYTIAAISGDQITITGDFTISPAAGDRYRIYDDDVACEVNATIYE